jgi:hypothetical protein
LPMATPRCSARSRAAASTSSSITKVVRMHLMLSHHMPVLARSFNRCR